MKYDSLDVGLKYGSQKRPEANCLYKKISIDTPAFHVINGKIYLR
jgi:hypothetical protein